MNFFIFMPKLKRGQNFIEGRTFMKILGRTLLVTGRAIYRVDDHGHLDFVFLLFSSLIDRPISDLAY